MARSIMREEECPKECHLQINLMQLFMLTEHFPYLSKIPLLCLNEVEGKTLKYC